MPSKARFHKGVTSEFRRMMKGSGLAFDEEAAQFSLMGLVLVRKQWAGVVETVRHRVFEGRAEAERQWEGEHPGVNPFPAPFPERVYSKLEKLANECATEELMGFLLPLEEIMEMCRNELRMDDDWIPRKDDK